MYGDGNTRAMKRKEVSDHSIGLLSWQIKPGKRPTFNDLYSMDYLVRGVIGSAKG